MAVAITGIIALALGNAVRYLMRNHVRAQAQADLNEDIGRVVNRLETTLSKAGDGVPNTKTPVGYSIFASTGLDSIQVTFFSEDTDTGGVMTANDKWMRFVLVNGEMIEEQFVTDRWTNIPEANVVSALRISSAPFKVSDGVRFKTLQFNFYKSDGVQITDAYAASYVRVHIELQKVDAILNKDAWILLGNVLHARQLP